MHLRATTLQPRHRPPYRVDQLPTSGQRRRSITDAEIPRDSHAFRPLHSAAAARRMPFFRSKKLTRGGDSVTLLAHSKSTLHSVCRVEWPLHRAVGYPKVLLFCILCRPLSSETTPKSLTAAFPRCPTPPVRHGAAAVVGPISRVSSRPILNPAAAAAKGEMRSEKEGSEDGMGEDAQGTEEGGRRKVFPVQITMPIQQNE